MLLLRVKINLKLNPIWFPRKQRKRNVKEKENSQYLVTDNEAQNNLNKIFLFQNKWHVVAYVV